MNKEVYIAYGENNEVLYVGQGNVGRHKHCLSGTSHNRNLNRYYFKNGEDGSIRVEVLHTSITQDEAIEIERELINSLKPLFNGIIPNGSAKMLKEKPKFIPYQKTIQEYIVAMQNGDIDRVCEIDNISSEYKAHYDLIGAKKLKALNYKPSKVKGLYACIILKMKYAQDIRDEMGLEMGGIYSAQHIKKLLKVSFKKHLINETVRLSSIEFFYDVKYTQMRLNGKQTQAVKILGVNYE